MHRTLVLRRLLVALTVITSLAAHSLPALAVDSAGFEKTREAWTTNRTQLAEASEGLEELDAATAEAAAAYTAVQQRLVRAQKRLDALRGTLANAVSQQVAAERANDVAIRRLGQATMVLVTIEDALALHLKDLEVEVVAAYKYAGSSARFRGIIEALQESGSITEFTNAYEQLRTSTIGQKELVDGVTALAERVTEQRVIVRTLQRETDAAERAAVSRRAGVAKLTKQQAELVDGVRDAKAERRRLLKKLRLEQADVAKRVEALQAQSDALMEELRKYRYVGGAPGSKDMLWPTDGGVTSGFGYRSHPILKYRRLHAGVDIPAPSGQPIYAAADGTVVVASPSSGYGLVVAIDHGEGLSTVYAHQSKLNVRAGQTVLAGDTVGYIGTTGLSTGPHLHFEVRQGGHPVDPLDWY